MVLTREVGLPEELGRALLGGNGGEGKRAAAPPASGERGGEEGGPSSSSTAEDRQGGSDGEAAAWSSAFNAFQQVGDPQCETSVKPVCFASDWRDQVILNVITYPQS